MLSPVFGALLSFALEGIIGAGAVAIPATRRIGSADPLRARAGSDNTVVLTNHLDNFYTIPLIVGGTPFEVQIDTGSTDLWVRGSVADSQDTDIPVDLGFVGGDVKGSAAFATVEIGGFTLDDQLFLPATVGTISLSGILGLGFSGTSSICSTCPRSSSPLINYFQQNPSVDPFFTVRLGRNTTNEVSLLSVSEIISGGEGVTAQPKIPVALQEEPDHQFWYFLLDDGGFKINDQTVPLPSPTNTSFTGGKNQLLFLVDTGFTLPQFPENVAHAIYDPIPGAKFDSTTKSWDVPCQAVVNLTAVVGGITIPIHPLDIVIPSEDDENACTNGIQIAHDPRQDGIFGMGVLRNMYALFNVGNFFGNDTTVSNPPYMQMLPLTKRETAVNEFISVRGGATFSDFDPAKFSVDSSEGASSSSAESAAASTKSPAETYATASTTSASSGSTTSATSTTSTQATSASPSPSSKPNSARALWSREVLVAWGTTTIFSALIFVV